MPFRSLPPSTSGSTAALDRSEHAVALAAVLVLAFAVRVGAIIVLPGIHHPDENFQLLEQGHRFAFGYGVVPWEFREGTRSPVLPLLLGLIFAATEPVVGGPDGYLFAARIVLAVASLATVAAVFRMGTRESPAHGIMAGFVAAIWFEIVYFAGRPLTEAVATTVLVVALSLATVPASAMMRRRLAAIGFCLGLCLMLRMHLAPGLLVTALFVGRGNAARWMFMALGGLVPVAVFGAADWAFWGVPFSSYVQAFRVNVLLDKASQFGVEPRSWYFEVIRSYWAHAALPVAALVAYRAKASTMWVAVALAIIASHSLIPHKEYRFVFPAMACLVIVAALGSADLVAALKRWTGSNSAWWMRAILALWLGLSSVLAFSSNYLGQWFHGRVYVQAGSMLAREPNLCGVLVYSEGWFHTGGYAHLHRNVPLYALSRSPERVRENADAYNAVIARRPAIEDLPPQFVPKACFAAPREPDLCVLMREGPCTPATDLELNAMLRRTGQ